MEVRERLADLDEIVLRCKNEHSRRFLVEAVQCYHSGAFRSCIIITWVAVVFDIIQKLHLLDLAGEPRATAEIAKWEKIQASHDVVGSLNWERKILELARDQFEFISQMEYADLSRLQEDRHRCAHPTMNSQDEIYAPSAELARYHLRNALTHLLQHPPVQGKIAQRRLEEEVKSAYFPTSVEAAVEYYRCGPLVRPRESLIRNFTIILLKTLLLQESEEMMQCRILAALGAIRAIHPTLAKDVWNCKLNEILRSVEDRYLFRAVRLLHNFPEVWDDLASDVCGVLSRYVKALPEEHLHNCLLLAIDTKPLNTDACDRLKAMTATQINNILTYPPHPLLLAHAINLYIEADDFATANQYARKLISPLVTYLKKEHVENIIAAVPNNDQLANSTSLESLVTLLQKSGPIKKNEFDLLLRAHHLFELADKLNDNGTI